MRFYVQRRVPRILISLLWVALGIFWLDVLRGKHRWHVLGTLVWIVLPLVQLATLWSYWETTETDLRHCGLAGRRPRYRLADLVYVGDVRRSDRLGRYLKKAIEIQFAGGAPRYITVAEPQRLRAELRRYATHNLQPTDAQ